MGVVKRISDFIIDTVIFIAIVFLVYIIKK